MDIKEFKYSDKIILPSEGETVAIAHKDKTAALCYDRIWSPLPEGMPDSIRCFGGSKEESAFVRLLSDRDHLGRTVEKLIRIFKGQDTFENKLKVFDEEMSPISFFPFLAFLLKISIDYRQSLGFEDTFDIKETDQFLETIKGRLSDIMKVLEGNPKKLENFVISNVSIFYKPVFRKISKSFYEKHGIPMIPIYGSVKERDNQYNEGDKKAIVIALSNIKVVDEDNLTWEQVLEFRADKEIQQKYKRFLHWLDGKMIGKSQAFVEDDISIRLKDYEQALKKHGIKTVVGEVSEVLAGGGLVGLADPKLGFLTAGALVVGKVVVKVAKILLDFDDVERGQNSEISWVYEVKKLGK